MQKVVRDWEFPFTESREGHQEETNMSPSPPPPTGWAVQTHGLQASNGMELSVVREFLGELWDAWMFGEIQGLLPNPGLEKFKCETLA